MEGIIKKERIIVHNKEEGRKEESASLRIWGTTIHLISYRYSQFLWFPFDMILVCKWKRLKQAQFVPVSEKISWMWWSYDTWEVWKQN